CAHSSMVGGCQVPAVPLIIFTDCMPRANISSGGRFPSSVGCSGNGSGDGSVSSGMWIPASLQNTRPLARRNCAALAKPDRPLLGGGGAEGVGDAFDATAGTVDRLEGGRCSV